MPNRCVICNGWNDPMQWPEDDREDFDPFMCYTCARQASIRKADALEEESNEVTQEELDADLDAAEKEMEGGIENDD